MCLIYKTNLLKREYNMVKNVNTFIKKWARVVNTYFTEKKMVIAV